MKKLLSTKKRIAMAAGLLVVAIGASAAFAYWTASGDYVVSAPDGGTLKMNDTSSNQDACKTATVTLHLKVDNSAI